MRPTYELEAAAPASPAQAFSLVLPELPVVALGLAVQMLMGKPAFARLPFGEWSRVLVGQINRGHCRFAIGANGQPQGFAGWAMTSEAMAEAWIAGLAPLSAADSLAGDCVVFNAWTAANPAAHRFMTGAFRELFADKRRVFFIRRYAGGRTRAVRLDVPTARQPRLALVAA